MNVEKAVETLKGFSCPFELVKIRQIVNSALEFHASFSFADLLELPCVLALEHGSAADRETLGILKLFCWGSAEAFHNAIPQVKNSGQSHQIQRKLMLLALRSIAKTKCKLSLQELSKALCVEEQDWQTAEDAIIEAVDYGLIEAQIDQHKSCVDVSWVSGGDMEAEGIDEMLAILTSWEHSSRDLLKDIETSIYNQDRAACELLAKKKRNEEECASRLETYQLQQKAKNAGGMGSRRRHNDDLRDRNQKELRLTEERFRGRYRM